MGALLGHITGGADATTFQPMNVNFGLFPPIDGTLQGQGAQAGDERAGAARFRRLAEADAARRSRQTTMRLMQPEPAAALLGLRAMKTVASVGGPIQPSRGAR